jgi:4'-phosphopantetheinyl transferase
MMRFRYTRDGRRYLTSHANMRRLLASYSDCTPRELAFVVNEYGKPRLRKLRRGKPLYFNLSHSDDLGLLAVTRMGDVGADIECIRPIEPYVAEEHFSATELEQLKTLTGDAWLAGFYRCWTRKEAILKAEGCGLNLPLGAFDVSLLPGEPAALRAVRPEIHLSRQWKLANLAPEAGVIGAVAADESYTELQQFWLADQV